MPQAEYEAWWPRSSATTSRSSPRSRLACDAAVIPAASPPTTTTRSLMPRGYVLRQPAAQVRTAVASCTASSTRACACRGARGSGGCRRSVDLQVAELRARLPRRPDARPAPCRCRGRRHSAEGAAAPQRREVGAFVEVGPGRAVTSDPSPASATHIDMADGSAACSQPRPRATHDRSSRRCPHGAGCSVVDPSPSRRPRRPGPRAAAGSVTPSGRGRSPAAYAPPTTVARRRASPRRQARTPQRATAPAGRPARSYPWCFHSNSRPSGRKYATADAIAASAFGLVEVVHERRRRPTAAPAPGPSSGSAGPGRRSLELEAGQLLAGATASGRRRRRAARRQLRRVHAPDPKTALTVRRASC